MRIIVGTRGSPLATTQTGLIVDLLRRHLPEVEFVVQEIRTQGDIAAEAPLSSLPRGIFAKELEVALSRGEIDLAVHSFKDLQTDLPEGMAIAAITQREDPRDVLIAPGHASFTALPQAARVGTSSPRRTAQLRAARPDLIYEPIRGNVGTRIDKAKSDGLDAVVLAAAGVHRLGLSHEITEYLAPELCTPEAGQGALAVEVRADDERSRQVAQAADHAETRIAVTAEVETLKKLGGGCKVPIATYAEVHGDEILLRGMVGELAGPRILRAHVTGPASHPMEVGRRLAQALVDQGARELLAEGS